MNESTVKGALCDDFDDDDEELKSDCKLLKSSSAYHVSVGGYKKESTLQRDQDKIAPHSAKMRDKYSWGRKGSDGDVSLISQSIQGSSVNATKRGHYIEDSEFADIEALLDSDVFGVDASLDRDRDRDNNRREGDLVPSINRTSSSSSSSSSSAMKVEGNHYSRGQHLNSDAIRPTSTPINCISKSRSSSGGTLVAAIPVTASAGFKAR